MFGQIPDFTNGFEFMRKLWGSGAGGGLMPGLQAMTPPMDLEDLDKRIHDLKAVEGWLQLNTNLLRTTIQGLEVQRATLVALQTFGNALSPDAMQSAMENVARAANTPSAAPPHRAEPAAQAATAAETPEPPPLPEGHAAAGADPSTAVPPNAGLWWDLLQQQFNQIASSAAAASMAPFGVGGFGNGGTAAASSAAAAKTAAKPAAKPAAKSAGKPARKAAGGAAAKAGAKAAPKRKSAPRKKPASAPKAPPAAPTPAKPDDDAQ
ncbi:PhaM family polyhydroxyalkanoate granule multifunctional regulatory protein [Cupriavidus sp. IDO]|uniref:PhaM family polyhydroxyalkanoate granule multifunctional regulatory protein n=1 Tax=Cupriavidus sp. IDO TaxID=1539142 RepID=UPI00057969AB|nr:PhaM family polyhydroxyalkanoate granule multifunctional regulatory protein [Cupriavidus sp. IDO]KWR88282.1 hypothetical protein RM96_20535 [Cupriavidus sp. IDO]